MRDPPLPALPSKTVRGYHCLQDPQGTLSLQGSELGFSLNIAQHLVDVKSSGKKLGSSSRENGHCRWFEKKKLEQRPLALEDPSRDCLLLISSENRMSELTTTVISFVGVECHGTDNS